jgi:hypothetical protein
MQALDNATRHATKANCTLIHAKALSSLHKKVACTGVTSVSAKDIYFKAAYYWHNHPGLQHLPQAHLVPNAKVMCKLALADLHGRKEELALLRAGDSISTSSGHASSMSTSFSSSEMVCWQTYLLVLFLDFSKKFMLANCTRS